MTQDNLTRDDILRLLVKQISSTMEKKLKAKDVKIEELKQKLKTNVPMKRQRDLIKAKLMRAEEKISNLEITVATLKKAKFEG